MLALLALAGCWVGEAQIQDKIDGYTPSDDEVEGPIEVVAVDPPWGTAVGGTEVTVSASPVGEGTVVRFGGEVATVLDVTDDAIVVRAPAHAPGRVALDVQWGAKAGTLDDAFEYFPDGTGKYGAIGTVAFIDVVGLLANFYDDGGYAWVNLTEPDSAVFSAFYGPSLDTCQSGWSFPGTIVEVSDAEALVLERLGGAGLTLAWSEVEDAFAADLGAPGASGNAFAYQATYDLAPLLAGGKLPPVGVDALVRTPGSFQVQVDSTLSDGPEGLDALLPPQASRDGFELRWSGAGTGDYIVARLELWTDSEASAPAEVVRCLLEDDGSFHVPTSAWATSPQFSSDLYVSVGRVLTSDGVFPHNNAMSGVTGVAWVLGVVTLYGL